MADARVVFAGPVTCGLCGHRHSGECAHWGCGCRNMLPSGPAELMLLAPRPYGPLPGERDSRLRFTREFGRLRCVNCGARMGSRSCQSHARTCWFGRDAT